jgi:hypothetical protein
VQRNDFSTPIVESKHLPTSKKRPWSSTKHRQKRQRVILLSVSSKLSVKFHQYFEIFNISEKSLYFFPINYPLPLPSFFPYSCKQSTSDRTDTVLHSICTASHTFGMINPIFLSKKNPWIYHLGLHQTIHKAVLEYLSKLREREVFEW